MKCLLPALACCIAFGVSAAAEVSAAEPSAKTSAPTVDLFRRDNLIAWCIVPFDAKKRGPEERAAMLARLGFKHFAYDYRAEHVLTFDAEIEACKRHGVSLDAWWFPNTLNDEARHILAVCKNNGITPQLWVSGGGTPTNSPAEQQQRISQEAARLRPIAEAAAAQGMKIGLYNHGNWFGEPENQIAVIEHLKLPNVGIVYNLHHGHDHVDRFAELLRKMLPHLLAVNLNGMNPAGDRQGQKILPLGQGELDLQLLRAIRDSGYSGPIGILGHTQDDAEARLQDNLDGLDWLVAQLDGLAPGARPKPRTSAPQAPKRAATSTPTTGFLATGREEYRAPPLTVELRATLHSKSGYNILVASDIKTSVAHWELFSMPQSGALTVYLPGRKPDHLRTSVNICDGQPHHIAMVYEPHQVTLMIDGKQVADQRIEQLRTANTSAPAASGLAFGRLVEGGLRCDGVIDYVRLSRGVRPTERRTGDNPPQVDADTLGLWVFEQPAAPQVLDRSKFQNHAQRVAVADSSVAGKSAQPAPPPGVHLQPVDARLRATLIDRSPKDVYLGVKVDVDGCVFVGGREAVFVFEPQPAGGFAPRRELLRFPPDSIIMGLEFRGDDLYVLAANALYRVPEGRVRRANLKPQRILWGLPLDLHVSFHCLAWGPDGDLYLTHGDPLLQYGDWSRPDHWGHWTLYCGPDARPAPYTGQGAVLRLKPDGTDVRVVATGLRGPVGLAFDRHGNLFTNDNDHESRADQYAPARLLHVVPGIDFGWPRGWMASKSPDRFELLETMSADLGRGVPCDLLWYDHSHLGATIGERLLMCRWDRFAVTAYRLMPRGISFSATEETLLTGQHNARPTGIAVGPDGRLFVTCLYMTGNMASPDCASDLIVVESAAVESADKPAASSGPASASPLRTNSDFGAFDDTYLRQLTVAQQARETSLDALSASLADDDLTTRLLAVLALGRRLTVPPTDYVPPVELKLFYPRESSFFKREQRFYGSDATVDLATLARVGSFTTAEWWHAIEHTPDQQRAFECLVRETDDRDDRVRLQAAYFLSLLKDARSEALVESTRNAVLVGRLSAAAEIAVERVWTIGPFADDDEATTAHPPEQGSLDLTASYGPLSWQEQSLDQLAASSTAGTSAHTSRYLCFRMASGTRQSALLTIEHPAAARIWLNGSPTRAGLPNTASGVSRWLVDLQPGSNDVLVRLTTSATTAPSKAVRSLRIGAVSKVAISLPEKLDSALLAARLREAATAGNSTAISAEFLAEDWSAAMKTGDAAEGRRLFGTLACGKCHAIVADQQGGGAPSLVEARRRFTVPHLIESILMPSRQVAEPFRAQTITTDQGQAYTGLVVAETAEAVELVLPDAQRRSIPKSRIEERAVTLLSPMPQGLVKTPAELRNLLAYLLSERPTPP